MLAQDVFHLRLASVRRWQRTQICLHLSRGVARCPSWTLRASSSSAACFPVSAFIARCSTMIRCDSRSHCTCEGGQVINGGGAGSSG